MSAGDGPLEGAPSEEPLRLLHQGARAVVVDKPSGLSVHRGTNPSPDNVLSRLHRQLGAWVWPSHRLDRATSGALVFALDEEAASRLAAAFRDGEIDKTYLAWVRGAPAPREGRIDYAIPRAEGSAERVEAATRYETVAVADDVRTGRPRYGLVIARPETGRYHQIRRHLRHVHCPILGDTTYGDTHENRALREHGGLHRLALHALAITIPDPDRAGERLRVVAPIPEDLRAPMRRYGITDALLDALERASG